MTLFLLEDLPADVIAVDGRPVTQIFALNRFVLSPGNRIDLDVTIPQQAGGKTYIVEDRFSRNAFQLASIIVKPAKPLNPPEFSPPTEASYIPARMFEKIEVEKNILIRGGQRCRSKCSSMWTL